MGRGGSFAALVGVCSALLIVSAAACAGVAEGIAAYQGGDYAAALRELRPAAEAGDAKAQSLLGYMYDFGIGVPHDDKVAAEWYRRAAEQGDPVAAENLGNMYGEGAGVPEGP